MAAIGTCMGIMPNGMENWGMGAIRIAPGMLLGMLYGTMY